MTKPLLRARALFALILTITASAFAPKLAAVSAQPLAFPGAEGAGRFAAGGRGGDVYHVTTLADAGPGSFRHGIESATGPRTIVFDISGTIEIRGKKLSLNKSNITIAGQTAPGDGITFKDGTFEWLDSHDLIIRFIRIRYGDRNKVDGDDATRFDGITNSIVDHCSISWGVDGEHDQRNCKDITWQWTLIAEALNNSIHPERHKPENHGKLAHAMAASFREMKGDITIHHNIIASCRERYPSLGGSPATLAASVTNFSNNLLYNQVGATNLGKNICIIENNYYRPGPLSDYRKKLPISVKAEPPDTARGWVAGNHFETYADYNKDNYTAIDYGRWTKHGTTTREKYQLLARPDPHKTDIARLQPPAAAYESMLTHAGASFARDAVDARIVSGIRDRTHTMIDSQDQVGGWPVLKSTPVPLDTDQDGMPDAWEIAHNLDPKNPDDRNACTLDKNYTNLEVYLNSLVAHIIK